MSLICSLSFWMWLVLSMIGVMPNLKIPFNYGAVLWLLTWIMAVVLAFKAAARGSRKWRLAALLPVVNYLFVSYVMSV